MRLFKIIFILLTFILLSNSLILENLWHHYKTAFSKTYSSISEETYRFQAFQQNLQLLNQIQELDHTAEYGITKFMDLTPEEFELLYLGYTSEPVYYKPPKKIITSITSQNIPDSWDWRSQGAVTPPKDQGICGACWAFAAIAAIESQYFIKHNVSYNFSEQQLIDCDTSDKGCYGGGAMIGAYSWLDGNEGLETSNDYPYFGFDMPCVFNSTYEVAKLYGYMNISQDEDTMAEALYTYGPLSTGINAYWLQFYKKGIMSPLKCSNEKLNHAVTLVGFGSQHDKSKAVDFWIAKNSWGSNWGEEGFFRIKKGDGVCGINLNVSVPIVE